MKIYTENFVKYADLIKNAKDQQTDKSEFISLNFEDGYMYMNHNVVDMRMKFNFEKEDMDEKVEPILVYVNHFLHIASNYDYLRYDFRKKEFYYEDDIIKLEVNDDVVDYNLIPYDFYDNENIFFDSKLLNNFAKMRKFLGEKSSDSNFYGMYYHNNKLYSGSGYYYAILNYKENPSINKDLIFNGSLIDFIHHCGKNFHVDYYYDDEGDCISIDNGEFEMVTSKQLYFAIDEDLVESDQFKDSLNPDGIIKIKINVLKEELSFLSPFLSGISLQKIELHLDPENPYLRVNSLVVKIKRDIKIESYSKELENYVIDFDFKILNSVLSTIEGDTLVIKYPTVEDSSAYVMTSLESEFNLITSKIVYSE